MSYARTSCDVLLPPRSRWRRLEVKPMLLLLSKRALLILVISLLPAWSCVGAEPLPLAELITAETTEAGLSVTVPTGGCTQKSDFEVTSSGVTRGEASIEIRRLRPDHCKGNFPEGMKLVFTWDDLKLPKDIRLLVKNRINAQRRAKASATNGTEQAQASRTHARKSAHARKPTRARRHARLSARGAHWRVVRVRRHRYPVPRRCHSDYPHRFCHELIDVRLRVRGRKRPSCW
jgi:hypothetical protein